MKRFWVTLALCIMGIGQTWAADGPSRAGLAVWLDGTDAATLERGPDGRLAHWRDKSGHGRDAVNTSEKSNPTVISPIPPKGGTPQLVRFNGRSDSLAIAGPIRAARGPVTAFVVSQRSAEQAAQIAAGIAKHQPKLDPSWKPWQRLLASTDGSATPDNKLPNFNMCATREGEGRAYPLTVFDQEFDDVTLGSLRVGANAAGTSGFLTGDIAEVLVYDRRFLAEGDIRVVRDTLKNKWGARLAYEETGWTRIGALEDPPRRVTDAWPLSDQQNKHGWVKVEAFSDEFDGNRLDTAKWRDHFDTWKGRAPARFNPANVSVSGGKLHLVMRKGPIPKELEAPGYAGYTSAAVQSLTKTGYGCYEVLARPMNSGGSSSFWFSGSEGRNRTEIDVFEIGGKAAGFERRYNMNLHVFETPREKRHWSIGGVWNAPWRLADDYHVYGLEWGKDEIVYYVDGEAVRRVKNTNWHFPLSLDFDSETMPDWFGMPKDEDLPSTYSIEYVRAWK